MIKESDNIQGPSDNEYLIDEITDIEKLSDDNKESIEDENDEIKFREQETVDDDEESDNLDRAEVGIPEDEIVPDPPKVSKKRKQKVVTKVSIVREYYKQYINYIQQRKPDKAILSFTNIVINLLRKFNVNDANYIVERFRKDASLLSYKVAMQQINTIPANNRIKVETIFVLIMGLVKKNKKIDFNKVRDFIGNQDVVNYFIKRYKRI